MDAFWGIVNEDVMGAEPGRKIYHELVGRKTLASATRSCG